MGGYTIEDVPHHDLSQEALDTLRQQDEEQAALMAEAIIHVDVDPGWRNSGRMIIA